jgi:hypothetical protein
MRLDYDILVCDRSTASCASLACGYENLTFQVSYYVPKSDNVTADIEHYRSVILYCRNLQLSQLELSIHYRNLQLPQLRPSTHCRNLQLTQLRPSTHCRNLQPTSAETFDNVSKHYRIERQNIILRRYGRLPAS